MPLAEINDFTAVIDKTLFWSAIKSKQEACKKFMEMSRNNNYTTEKILDFSYHQKLCKLIGIDLSR